jgi:branched-chain amino acid transport system permease protein
VEGWLQVLVNGVVLGATYVLLAAGLTLVFSILGVVNFSHGEMYMLGAFATYVGAVKLGLDYFAALGLAMAAVGLLGLAAERVLLRPLGGRELNMLVMTLAMAILFQNVILIIRGPDEVSMRSPFSGAIRFGEVAIAAERLAPTAVSLALMVGLVLFIRTTRTGLAIRAVAQDPDAAFLQGIDVRRVHAVTFGVGAALAAGAGGLMAPIFFISPFIGGLPVMKAFIVIILGGMGSVPGAIVGGFLLGMIESVTGTALGSAVKDIVGFVIVIGVLVFKPSGLLGQRV